MKTILTISLVIISTFGYTQMYLSEDFEYEVGETYENKEAKTFFLYKSHNIYKNNNLLTLKRIKGGAISIQKFSTTDLKLTKTNIVIDMPRRYNIEHITEYNNKHLFFYSRWDGDIEEYHLFYREIDFENSTLKKESTMLFRILGKKGGPFKFYYSNDSTHMLIKYRKRPIIKDDAHSKEVNGLYVYNNQMKKISGKEITMPYTERKMDNLDYSIDTEGNIYILTRVFYDNSARMKIINNKPNYHIEILRYTNDSENPKSFTVSVDKIILTSMEFFINKNQDIICVGLYAYAYNIDKVNDIDYIRGMHICRLSSEGEILNNNTIDFPDEIINQDMQSFLKSKKKQKKETGLRGLELTDYYLDKDGSIIIIAEQQFNIYSDRAGGITYHEFVNMLISKINPQGVLEWMKKLPKNQFSVKESKADLSYKHLVLGENHYLIFVDKIDNLDIPYNEPLKPYIGRDGGFLTAYRVSNKTGETRKLMVLYTKDVDGNNIKKFTPDGIIDISDKEFIFEAYTKRKEKALIKVKLMSKK